VDVEKRKVWEKQVLIPHKLKGKMHAFAGPYPPSSNFTDEVKNFFPCHVDCEPSIFIDSEFDMSFMKSKQMVFKSAPLLLINLI
jgi:hypothetical protein